MIGQMVHVQSLKSLSFGWFETTENGIVLLEQLFWWFERFIIRNSRGLIPLFHIENFLFSANRTVCNHVVYS